MNTRVKNAIKRVIRKTATKLTGFNQGGLWMFAAMAALVFATSLPQGAQAANVTPTNESMVLNGDTLVVGQAGATAAGERQ